MGRLKEVLHPGTSGIRDWFAYARSGVQVASMREFVGSCILLDARLRPSYRSGWGVGGVADRLDGWFYDWSDNPTYSYRYEWAWNGSQWSWVRTNRWTGLDWAGNTVASCDGLSLCSVAVFDTLNRVSATYDVQSNAAQYSTLYGYGTSGSDNGLLKTVTSSLDSEPATLTYQADGDLSSIGYSGGDFSLTVGYDVSDRVSKLDWKKGGVLVASDEVVRSPGGRVIGELIDGSGWTTNNATAS